MIACPVNLIIIRTLCLLVMTIPAPAFAFKDINATARLSNKHHFFNKSERKILLISSEKRNRFNEAVEYNNTGFDYADKGQPDKAIEYFERALSIFRELKDKQNEASLLNNIGSVYNEIGQTQKALEYYEKALVIFQELKGNYDIVTALSNIAVLYGDLGYSAKSLEYLERAYKEANEPKMVVIILNNFGQVYKNLGQFEKALEYQQKALASYQDFRNVINEKDRGIEAGTLALLNKE